MASWVLAALAAVGLRAYLVQQSLGAHAGCSDCLLYPALRSDAWPIALTSLLAAVFLGFRNRVLRVLAGFGLALFVCLLVADVIVFATLSMRLYFADIAKFGREVPAITEFLVAAASRTRLVLAALALVALYWLVLKSALAGSRHPRSALSFAALAACLGLFAVLPTRDALSFVHQDSVVNVLALNFDQGVSRPYSAAFQSAAKPEPGTQVCAEAPVRRPNVLLVVVESLSAVHSARQGGLGWTPQLDRIAAENSWYSDFHANGFTTDHGLIALLTGKVPLPSVGRYGSAQAYAGFFERSGSLADQFAKFGYSTHFFTTGDLGFLDKGKWCQAIGFEHVEGAEQSFYQGWSRRHFNAAEDKALYLRFDQWRNGHLGRDPYFATLLTVSSHPPFIHPTGGPPTEESVIRYTDAELGAFYDRLKASGFFADGLLIIVGDHRAMTPLRPAERSAYGDRALSRVQMIVAGAGRPPAGRQTVLAQQADLVHSLLSLLGPRHCRPAERGDFLSPAVAPPAYVLHVRGDRRSILNAYFGDRTAYLHLNGDDSGWLGEAPPASASILAGVNRERIGLGLANNDYLDYVIGLRTGRR